MRKILFFALMICLFAVSCTEESNESQMTIDQQIETKLTHPDLDFTIIDIAESNEQSLLSDWNESLRDTDPETGEVKFTIVDGDVLDIKHARVVQFPDNSFGIYGFATDLVHSKEVITLVAMSSRKLKKNKRGHFEFNDDLRSDTGQTVTCSKCDIMGPAGAGKCVPRQITDPGPTQGEVYCSPCRVDENGGDVCEKSVTQEF